METEKYVSIFAFFCGVIVAISGVLMAIEFHSLFVAIFVLLIFGITSAPILLPEAAGYFFKYLFILFIINVIIVVILTSLSTFIPNLHIPAFVGPNANILMDYGDLSLLIALSVIFTVLKLRDED